MKTKKLNFFERFLNFFENVGNKMPDPVTLSFILCILVIIISKFIATAGISAIHPKSGETLLAVDLLTKTGFQKIFTSIISNFQGFPPLGVVLVTMFGAGVAEKTGFMEELLKVTTVKIPKPLVTACILFIGILANAAGDAGFIILPPLAAIIFISLKRHPLVGMLAAYAGVAAGFAANIFISISDVLAATFTIPAAQILDKNYTGTVAMNFYFLFVSTFVLVITGVFVTEKIIAPGFEGVEYDYHDEKIKEQELKAFPITQEEKNIKLSANQSLYDNHTLKQWINHKISQSILYDSLNEPKLEDLENYIRLNHDYGSISGKVIYNVEDQEFVENNADTNFIYNDLSLTLGYYKTKYTENIFNDREDLESYRIVTSYKIAKDYKLSYYENYNLLDNIRSKQGVSLNINDSCWNMDIRYENEVVPSSRVNYEAIDQKIIFVNVMLKPLGGIKQKYKMEDNN